MEDSKYLNNITLQYLLNPSLYDKINKNNLKLDNDLSNEILFYIKRISHLTKEMSKGKYINNKF